MKRILLLISFMAILFWAQAQSVNRVEGDTIKLAKRGAGNTTAIVKGFLSISPNGLNAWKFDSSYTFSGPNGSYYFDAVGDAYFNQAVRMGASYPSIFLGVPNDTTRYTSSNLLAVHGNYLFFQKGGGSYFTEILTNNDSGRLFITPAQFLLKSFDTSKNYVINSNWKFNRNFSVGDNSSGTGINIDRVSDSTTIGDWQGGGNNTALTVDDHNRIVKIFATNGLSINGNQVATQSYVTTYAWSNSNAYVGQAQAATLLAGTGQPLASQTWVSGQGFLIASSITGKLNITDTPAMLSAYQSALNARLTITQAASTYQPIGSDGTDAAFKIATAA